ncbi:putative cbs domain-containing protein [Golovinomyces cichoracearum]|uniref:Putative cbs domain-containing protein n=1 Tax=Golovinomyces cichoracearum TaxID=62708 RepID=A0A420HP14_9PEZI|nr:putative cbs domain-containing protein [Golovinomyces cichoracearum]
MSVFHKPSRKWYIETRKNRPKPSRFERNHTDHRFDKATGQIYTETIVGSQVGDDKFWQHRPNITPNIGHHERTLDIAALNQRQKKANFKGTRSLLLTSLEGIVSNVYNLTSPLVELLSPQLIELLWKTLSERSLVSFHVWSLFSDRLNEDHNSLKGISRYSQIINTPRSALATYTRALTSINFNFITALTITIPFPLPDLVRLSELVNLVALEIINNSDPCQSSVSDFLVKAWSLSASNQESFQILRILKLWYHREITPNSLEHIARFPALAIYDVRGCSFDGYKHQRNLDWNFKGICDPLIKLEKYMNERVNLNGSLSKPSDQKSHTDAVAPNSWDDKIYKLIHMIGQIRTDYDFQKACFKVKTTSAYMKRRMGNAPLACLSLGPAHPIVHKSLLFLKMEVSDQNDKIEMSLASQQKVTRRKTKRKLHDLLGEFS